MEMEWVRGEKIGHGSFATISKAIPRKAFSAQPLLPPLMVVKSSESCRSDSLKNEKQVLDRIGSCPQIIRCFGDEESFENGANLQNLLLEYASGGSLADQLKFHGGRFPESDIRRYTRAILKGLSFVHAKGFVHCDIKLQNILVFDNGAAKIADFGLAKQTGETEQRCELRGTPLNMSPESVNDNEYESPSDIWALGCTVAEMVTGKPVWNQNPESNIWALLLRIGGEEVPEIPVDLSEEGKDFLRKCFIKDSRKRWTAEMLLNHAFVATDDDDDHDSNDTVPLEEASPRCPFDFPEWASSSEPNSPEFSQESVNGFEFCPSSTCFPSPDERFRRLLTGEIPNWSLSESWVAVRNYDS